MGKKTVPDIRLDEQAASARLAQQTVTMQSTLKAFTQAVARSTDKILETGTRIERAGAAEKASGTKRTADAAAQKTGTLPKAAGVFGDMERQLARIRAGIAAAFAPLEPALASAAAGVRGLQAAIGHLREGFGQMASVIAQAAAPALAALANGLATVLAYAGRLFAFLTGKTVKGAASAVADVGKAAGGAAKRTREAARSLADFDEINRLEAPRAGGGAGGGGAGGSDAAEAPDWVAKSPFLDRVLAAIEGGEWKKAGQLLAEKMSSLLKGWDARAFGEELGTRVQHALALLSGFITGAPWEENGRALADGAGRMLGPNQWNGLGARLAEAFNGLLAAIDPADLAVVLCGKLSILVRTVGAFFENLDYAQLAEKIGLFAQTVFYTLADSIASLDPATVGEGIGRFFQKLDWAGLAQSLGTLLGQAAAGAVEFMLGLLDEPFSWLRERFLEGFAAICGDEAWPRSGGQLIAGILAGILSAMAGIGGWIAENIFAPFLGGVCDAFGIESFSTVAADWGARIIDGLRNGLVGAWGRVSAFLGGMRGSFSEAWDAVCTGAGQAFTGLQNTLASIWSGISGVVRGAVNGIIGFINRLINGVAGGINLIADGLNSLHFRVPSWVPGIGGAELGFQVPHVSLPSIPYLAQGAVIPANREFLAVLGDQRHGTNVEAPLTTIQEAVRVELEPYIDAMMAGFASVVNAIREQDGTVRIGDETIGRALARYQSRMDVIRGSVAG